jgi:hypothetical protein
MQLKKPCQICNIPKVGLANNINQPLHPHHNAHLKNMTDRYELWLYLPDMETAELLVYLKSDTIEVFQKAFPPQQHNLLLLLLPIPANIKTEGIMVKKIAGGIHIIMPKMETSKQTAPILLPIEA